MNDVQGKQEKNHDMVTLENKDIHEAEGKEGHCLPYVSNCSCVLSSTSG